MCNILSHVLWAVLQNLKPLPSGRSYLYALTGTRPQTTDCVLVSQPCPVLCNLMSCSCQGTLSVEFSKQEYWSGLPFPSPGIKPGALELQVDVYCFNYYGSTRPQTGWKQKVDCVDSWLTHQQWIRRMSTSWLWNPQLPSLTLSLKLFPHSHLGILGCWVLAAWTTCFVPCDKHGILFHCNPHEQAGPGMVQQYILLFSR